MQYLVVKSSAVRCLYVLFKVNFKDKLLELTRFFFVFVFSGLFDFGVTASCHYGYRCCVHICVSVYI